MREITVATVQIAPELGSPENNLVKMSDMISTITAQQKVDLIVFPELATSGYELGVRFTEIAQRVPGPAINLMAQRAADAGVYIAFGLVTKEKVESIIYNSAAMVGPEGELLGVYHKVHLRGEERMAFREGFKLPVIDTGEIGKIGLMLGWDLAYPEVARSMVLEGADLLCVLSNWESSQIDEWKTYIRARAYENAVFIAAANRVGEDVTMTFGGESMIVGPRGRVYAALEADPGLKAELQAMIQSEMKLIAEKAAEAKEEKREEKRDDKNGDKPAEGEKKDGDKPVAALDGEKKDGDKPAESGENKEPKKDGEPVPSAVAAASPSAAVSSAPTAVQEPLKKSTKLDKPQEGFCVARIDLDEVRRFREEFQTLQTRQPTVYKTLVKRY
jgi:predicted amidohydrolase